MKVLTEFSEEDRIAALVQREDVLANVWYAVHHFEDLRSFDNLYGRKQNDENGASA